MAASHMTLCSPCFGDCRTGKARAGESADAWYGEGESVLPRREVEVTQHEHLDHRFLRHDEAAYGEAVEEYRTQLRVAEQVPPTVRQIPQRDLLRRILHESRLAAADGGDAER